LKLNKKARLGVAIFFFSNRVRNEWNIMLSEETIAGNSLIGLKENLIASRKTSMDLQIVLQ